jgi:hypothetical protein
MGIAATSVTGFRRLALLALAFSVLLVAFTARAEAADGSLLGCDYDASNPFLRFLDPLPYTLAPGGDFETGAAGWQLSGGAKIASGNESYYLSGSGTRSLQLPAGSSATSPPMCVGLILPVVRFVTQGGAALSTLKVEAVWTDTSNTQRSLVLAPGVVGGSSGWVPTLPLLQLGGVVNALTLNGLTTQMSFRFTPKAGLLGTGTWRIDDIYVDPWKTI